MSATITRMPLSPRPPMEGAAGAPAPQSSGRVVRTRLRITRRGRVVLTIAVVMALMLSAGLAMLFGADRAQATEEPGAVAFSAIVVAPGDTLWQIAERLAPEQDPRDVIAEVMTLNQLPSAELQAGQRIAIPLQYGDALSDDLSY